MMMGIFMGRVVTTDMPGSQMKPTGAGGCACSPGAKCSSSNNSEQAPRSNQASDCCSCTLFDEDDAAIQGDCGDSLLSDEVLLPSTPTMSTMTEPTFAPSEVPHKHPHQDGAAPRTEEDDDDDRYVSFEPFLPPPPSDATSWTDMQPCCCRLQRALAYIGFVHACPYVAEWVGDEEDDDPSPRATKSPRTGGGQSAARLQRSSEGGGISAGTLIVVLPPLGILSSDTVAVVELPASTRSAPRCTSASVPTFWNATRLAMLTRRRGSAQCVLCELPEIGRWISAQLQRSLRLAAITGCDYSDSAGMWLASRDAIVDRYGLVAA